MKCDLQGMFANIVADMKRGKRSMANYHAFCLDELRQHIEQTIQGEHTLKEFAEHYCLQPPPNTRRERKERAA